MAKTDWTIHDVVKPEDLNQLSQDVNEAGSQLDAHIGSRGNTHLTATRTEAGFMSPADKQELDKLAEEMGNMDNVPTQAKTVSGAIGELHAAGKSNESLLQGATSASTANTLVKRDASGRFKAAAPVAADDVARKAEIDAANNSISNHASNTSNPHSVTKAQVGLGNVPNYLAATQAQAEAGVDNGSFMTPLRTNQAIQKLVPQPSVIWRINNGLPEWSNNNGGKWNVVAAVKSVQRGEASGTGTIDVTISEVITSKASVTNFSAYYGRADDLPDISGIITVQLLNSTTIQIKRPNGPGGSVPWEVVEYY